MVTRVGVAIPVNELHILSKFGQRVLSRKKVMETSYFCFPVTCVLIHLSTCNDLGMLVYVSASVELVHFVMANVETHYRWYQLLRGH